MAEPRWDSPPPTHTTTLPAVETNIVDHYRSGLTVSDTARHAGVSPAAVRRALARNNVALRVTNPLVTRAMLEEALAAARPQTRSPDTAEHRSASFAAPCTANTSRPPSNKFDKKAKPGSAGQSPSSTTHTPTPRTDLTSAHRAQPARRPQLPATTMQ